MKEMADYDEIKRELEIMKYVEFSGADFGDDDGEKPQLPDPNASVANKQRGQSLEKLLTSKNRRLLEDLTKLRVSWEDLSSEHAKAEEIIEGLQVDLALQRGLVEKLEGDLMVLNNREDRVGTPGQGLAGLDIGGKPVSPLNHVYIKQFLMSGYLGRPCVARQFWLSRFFYPPYRHFPT